MHKKFEINQTKIKGGCQSGRIVVTHDSKRDLPVVQVDVLQNHMSTSHAIRVHAQDFFDKLDKN